VGYVSLVFGAFALILLFGSMIFHATLFFAAIPAAIIGAVIGSMTRKTGPGRIGMVLSFISLAMVVVGYAIFAPVSRTVTSDVESPPAIKAPPAK
jgi:hypothetical protein